MLVGEIVNSGVLMRGVDILTVVLEGTFFGPSVVGLCDARANERLTERLQDLDLSSLALLHMTAVIRSPSM